MGLRYVKKSFGITGDKEVIQRMETLTNRGNPAVLKGLKATAREILVYSQGIAPKGPPVSRPGRTRLGGELRASGDYRPVPGQAFGVTVISGRRVNVKGSRFTYEVVYGGKKAMYAQAQHDNYGTAYKNPTTQGTQPKYLWEAYKHANSKDLMKKNIRTAYKRALAIK